jgi:hypothetical protein
MIEEIGRRGDLNARPPAPKASEPGLVLSVQLA